MINIRKTKLSDQAKLFEMYKKAATYLDGLARNESEVTLEYVADFLSKVKASGLSYVALDKALIVGEIHSYRIGLDCFSHMLSNLTIAVDPDCHSQGIGRKLFTRFIEEVVSNHKDISRIELATRETHQNAIAFYQSMGFKIEGRFEGRVKCHNGCLVADIPMAWHRADYEETNR
jgi:putative acetyltransferase